MKYKKFSKGLIVPAIVLWCIISFPPAASAQTQGAFECPGTASPGDACGDSGICSGWEGTCQDVDGRLLCLVDCSGLCGSGYYSCNDDGTGSYSEGECFTICGSICPTSLTCTSGGPAWPPCSGLGDPDLQADEQNCGSCGNVCGAGETCEAGVCSSSTPTPSPTPPPGGATSIMLKWFIAAPGNSRVTLLWETSDEDENLGFNLYRADSEDGEPVKINDDLIPSEVGTGLGTTYKFIDDDVENLKTYYYTIEDVDVHGIETLHPPVQRATPNPLYAIIDLIIDLFFP